MTSGEYSRNLRNFQRVDGIKALILYGIYMVLLFIQGFAYTTNLSVNILNNLQSMVALMILVIGLGFIVLSREKLCSVGLNKTKLVESLLWGAALAACLLMGMTVYFRVVKNIAVRIMFPACNTLGLFLIGAIQEEVIFRGYIQTRLAGIMKRPVICSICTALLFLLAHYPVHWAAVGFSLSSLPPTHVISLIILHFACAFVYKKTNCLWGAIGLHLLYNIGQSMLIL